MEDDMESYRLSFNADDDCSVNERYRLQIEMKTKSMIRKQYNPFYTPCKIDKLGVSKKYKEDFLNTNRRVDTLGDSIRDEEDEINYLMINNSILKGFLENISSTTEDFKLEINQKNFSITAFTKGIFVKEKEILKQPMAVNIIFNTDELLDLKLFNNFDKQIVYRLKDFKTFLNLGGSNDMIEIWFKRPGDPALFEMTKNGVLIQFVQVTDGENSHHLEAKHTRVIPKERINKRRKEKANKKSATVGTEVYDHTIEMEKEFNEPLFVPNDEGEGEGEGDDFEDTNNDNDNGNRNSADITVLDQPQHHSKLKAPLKLPRVPTGIFESEQAHEEHDDGDEDMGMEDEPHKGDEISWGEPSLKDQKISQLISNSKSDEKRLIKEAKTKYLNDLKKRKINEKDNENEDELGPTQNISRAKGLFD